MKASALLPRLYPPGVRDRWGDEIGHEVAESGARAWADTVLGAGRLWLHPSDWPETAGGQTRRVVAVALFAITGLAALLLRATLPSTTLTADVHAPVTSLWLAPVLGGVCLATPFPPLRRAVLGRLVTVAFRRLAAPGVAVTALFAAARSGWAEHLSGPVDGLLVVFYWATLAGTAAGVCAIVADIARAANPPSGKRLHLALLLVGTGFALAACQTLPAALHMSPAALHPSAAATPAALALLAAAAITAARDLRA